MVLTATQISRETAKCRWDKVSGQERSKAAGLTCVTLKRYKVGEVIIFIGPTNQNKTIKQKLSNRRSHLTHLASLIFWDGHHHSNTANSKEKYFYAETQEHSFLSFVPGCPDSSFLEHLSS